MIEYSIQEFLDTFNKLSKKFFPGTKIKIIYQRLIHIKLRLLLKSNLFIDVYYNSLSNRFSIVIIKKNKRIFGIDNLEKFHYHPLKNPDKHINIKQLTLEEILKMVLNTIKEIKRQNRNSRNI